MTGPTIGGEDATLYTNDGRDETRHPVQNQLPGVGAIGDPPHHYAGKGMDVFAIIDAFDLDFYEGNAIKYLLRHKKKGGMYDLQKARHYLDEIILRAERAKNGT